MSKKKGAGSAGMKKSRKKEEKAKAPKPKVVQHRFDNMKLSKAESAMETAARALEEAQAEFSAAGKKKKAAESILCERMRKAKKMQMVVGGYVIQARSEYKVTVTHRTEEEREEEESGHKKRTGPRYGGEKDETAEVAKSKEKVQGPHLEAGARDGDSCSSGSEGDDESAGAAADIPAP